MASPRKTRAAELACCQNILAPQPVLTGISRSFGHKPNGGGDTAAQRVRQDDLHRQPRISAPFCEPNSLPRQCRNGSQGKPVGTDLKLMPTDQRIDFRVQSCSAWFKSGKNFPAIHANSQRGKAYPLRNPSSVLIANFYFRDQADPVVDKRFLAVPRCQHSCQRQDTGISPPS